MGRGRHGARGVGGRRHFEVGRSKIKKWDRGGEIKIHLDRGRDEHEKCIVMLPGAGVGGAWQMEELPSSDGLMIVVCACGVCVSGYECAQVCDRVAGQGRV
jgi:hypothetical protein